MTNLAIGAVVLTALVVVGLTIWIVPRWQVRGWRRAGIAEEEKLAELGVQARSSITQALGGLALVATLAITAYQVNETRRSSDANLRLAERGQASERFAQALGQLTATGPGGPAVDTRTGALFALRQIGIDFNAYAEPAFLLVTRYVANNYRPPKRVPPHGCLASFGTTRPDVVTALAIVLPALAATRLEQSEQLSLGLRGVVLDGFALDELVLRGFNLTGIKFRSASLVYANFSKSKLRGADFRRACLRRAVFRNADLRLAVLRGADLRGADLRDAKLRNADFTDAQLGGAKFTQDAIDPASLSAAQKRDIIIVNE